MPDFLGKFNSSFRRKKMKNSIRDDILGYVAGLPYWQQYLAAPLTQGITGLNREEAIEKAAQYFLSEKKLLLRPLEKMDLAIPTATNQTQRTNRKTSTLVSLSNLKNIGVLRKDQKLAISEKGLTVIYGLNGSGKSSYARVMNDAFISRGDINVIGNVFDSSQTGKPEAIFTFKNDEGKEYILKYPDKANSSEFREYATFDSKAVKVHIDSDNELSITPEGFGFFENLASLVSNTDKYIQSLIESKSETNLFPERFLEDSEIKSIVNNLNVSSDFENIKKIGSFTEKDSELLERKERELAGLNLDDLAEKKKLYKNITTEVNDLKENLEYISLIFSKENIDELEKQINQRKELIVEISDLGLQKFYDPRFKGIGSEYWKKFINAGDDFLDLQGRVWNEGDPCPYCRRDLTPVALKLIESYQMYLKSEAEAKLREIDVWIIKKIQEFQILKVLDPDTKSKAMSWLGREESRKATNTGIERALLYYSELKDNLLKSLGKKLWDDLVLEDFEFDWQKIKKTLEEEEKALDSEKIETKKKTLEIEIKNLKHKRILKELLPEIKIFLDKLSWINRCRTARNEVRTQPITNFSKTLYAKHVTDSYRETFQKECLKLNVRSIKLKHVGEAGNTKRRYAVGNSSMPSNTLSEGEQRVIALADFLTEIKISGINGGLVFDDPVASQDHERKERIAQRLAQEAQSRPVIIFTHDLAFLSDLENASSEKSVSIAHHWIDSNGVDDVGIIKLNHIRDFEANHLQPDIAKNRLEKAKNSENPQDKRFYLKDGFSALRASYEAFFAVEILKKSISRFDRRIKYHLIREVYAPQEVLDEIFNKLGVLSKNISAHLQVDMDASCITVSMLEKEIREYQNLYDGYIQERKRVGKNLPHKRPDQTTQNVPENSFQ